MKKERKTVRHFDDQFRLSVLKDYYESGASYYQIACKYDVATGNLAHFLCFSCHGRILYVIFVSTILR